LERYVFGLEDIGVDAELEDANLKEIADYIYTLCQQYFRRLLVGLEDIGVDAELEDANLKEMADHIYTLCQQYEVAKKLSERSGND
jgi:hypothetical protein